MGACRAAFLLALTAVAVVHATVVENEEDLLATNPQAVSNRASEFLVAFLPLDTIIGGLPPRPIVTLHITTEEPEPVEVTVDSVFSYEEMGFTNNDSFPMTGTVERGKALIFQLPTPTSALPNTGEDDIRVHSTDAEQLKKSLRVTAAGQKKISVYGLNQKSGSADAFLALPCIEYPVVETLQYLVVSNFAVDTSVTATVQDSQILLITCKDSAQISMRSTRDVVIPGDFLGPRIGQEQAINIPNNGTTLLLKTNAGDLSGTRFRSNVPLVVYAGHMCTKIPASASRACDHLVEQIPPHITWGTMFFVVPFLGRASQEIIIGTVERQEVQITCTSLGSSTPGITDTVDVRPFSRFFKFITSVDDPPQFCCIESVRPVIVMQFSLSHSIDDGAALKPISQSGDPFSVLIPPTTQYLNDYTLTSFQGIDQGVDFVNYINVAVADKFFDETDILMNGVQASPTTDGGWVPMYCSNSRICGYAGRYTVDELNSPNGVTTVAHRNKMAGINAMQYGFSFEVSYAYPGGFELEPHGLPQSRVPDATVQENAGFVTIEIPRNVQLFLMDSTFKLFTRDAGTGAGFATIAQAGSDYVPISMDLMFVLRETLILVNITIIDDDEEEPPERFELVMEPVSNLFSAKPIGTITILDDERPAAPEIKFNPITYTVNEGDGQVFLMIESSIPLPAGSAVFYTISGSATSGVDFEDIATGAARPVLFDSGQTTTTVSVSIVNDQEFEGDEVFTVMLRATDPAQLTVTDDTATVTIIDNDKVQVGFSPVIYNVTEGGQAMLRIEKFSVSSQPVTVIFSTADGTAIASGDYTSQTSVRVTFQPGETEKFVTVSAIADDIVENLETFEGKLVAADPNIVEVTQDTATVFITDNDAVEIGFVPTSFTVTEDSGQATFTVVKRGLNTRDVTAFFSTRDGTAVVSGDYTTGFNSAITFGPSDTSFTISVPLQNDTVYEIEEYFQGLLSSTDGGVTIFADTANATITDDDTVVIRFAETQYSAFEGSSTDLLVERVGSIDYPITVDLRSIDGSATAPLDYTAISQQLIFQPLDSTLMRITVFTASDTIIEGPEQFSAEISNPSPSDRVMLQDTDATVDILEIDRVQVGFRPTDYTVNEDGGFVTLNIVKFSTTDQPVTVLLSTTEDTADSDDYVPRINFTVTFQPSETLIQIPIAIRNDDTLEGIERFFAVLTAMDPSVVEIVNGTASISIIDGDQVTVTIVPPMVRVPENNSIVTICLKATMGIPEDLVVEVTASAKGTPGSATAPEDFIVTTKTVRFEQSGDGRTVCTTLEIVDDDIALEGDEAFNVVFEFVNPQFDVVKGTDDPGMVIIEDYDVVTVRFTEPVYTVDENGGPVVVCVEKDKEIAKPFTVRLPTQEGTASDGPDYNGNSQSVEFIPGGANMLCANFPITDDDLTEGTETFTVSLDPSDPEVEEGDPSTTTVNIIDDEMITIGFRQVTYNAGEADGVVILFVDARFGVINDDVDVRLYTGDDTAGAPADYASLNTVLRFSSTVTEHAIPVTIRDDELDEINERFLGFLRNVTFNSSVSISPDQATIIIRDDDKNEGCPEELDSVWQIAWALTDRGKTDTQPCPGGVETIGLAVRTCGDDGVWIDPSDVSNCRSLTFIAIEEEAENLAVTDNPEDLITAVTSQLTEATQQSGNISLLPQDLNTTNLVISSLLDITEKRNLSVDLGLVEVFDHVLDDSNSNGWQGLQAVDAGSQVLLENAERYGLLLADKQNDTDTVLSRPNIVIRASQYNPNTNLSLEFPGPEDLSNYSGRSLDGMPPARVQVPSGFVQDRVDEGSTVAVVYILFRNLEEFLPLSTQELEQNTRGASQVLSVQVGSSRMTPTAFPALSEDPIELTFVTDMVVKSSDYMCVYWNFSDVPGSGHWSSAGVQTVKITSEGDITTVQCEATHLTSFAVLVDVNEGQKDISTAESEALKSVSYIGCAISVVCLLATIVIFLVLRKTLLVAVHNIIHLNLAIALLLGYLLFLAGMETATVYDAACGVVAAFLQYFFLAAFCWMLCEGIYLYLILVVVFSTLSKKWWLFLLIGWATPVPMVAVTAGVRHPYYGVKRDGDFQYCWLSQEEGTIWGFVGPILVIVVVNVVFLVLALRVLLRTTGNKRNKTSFNKQPAYDIELARTLLRGSVILLPLLGVTWAIGVFALDRNSTVFAWIFTLLNSLQGLAIFVLHVIRNDKVKSKFGPRFSAFYKKVRRSIATKSELSTMDTSASTSHPRSVPKLSSEGTVDIAMDTVRSDDLKPATDTKETA